MMKNVNNRCKIIFFIVYLFLGSTSFCQIDNKKSNEYSDLGYKEKDHNLKIVYYSNAIRYNPSGANNYNLRGHAYYNIGNYELSIEDHTKAIELHSLYDYAYYWRAMSYIKLNKMELAILDIQKAIQIDPKYDKYKDFFTSLNTIARHDELLLKERLSDLKNSLSGQNKISDNVILNVSANVVEEINIEGKKELNLHVEYLYEVIKASIENKTDDFPAGEFKTTSSNAAKLTATLLKQTIETELSKYFTPGTRVSIKITGTTDGSSIKSVIPYGDEYGQFNDEICFINGILDAVTISKNTGITSNEQLAYLRTRGIRNFLETYVDPLKLTDNTFQHYAIVKKEIGAQHRKISVEIIIHDAFNLNKSKSDNSQDLSKLYIKCKKPVFMVLGKNNLGKSQGSGFFISSEGIGISNYHVFEEYKIDEIRLKMDDGTSLLIENIIEQDKEKDYIIFKVKNPNNKRFPSADITFLEAVEGEEVFAISNPMGFEKTLSNGIISAFRNGRDFIQTTTPISHGSSGGPLFNNKGEVIGITTGSLTEKNEGHGGNLYYAINIQLLNLSRFK